MAHFSSGCIQSKTFHPKASPNRPRMPMPNGTTQATTWIQKLISDKAAIGLPWVTQYSSDNGVGGENQCTSKTQETKPHSGLRPQSKESSTTLPTECLCRLMSSATRIGSPKTMTLVFASIEKRKQTLEPGKLPRKLNQNAASIPAVQRMSGMGARPNCRTRGDLAKMAAP